MERLRPSRIPCDSSGSTPNCPPYGLHYVQTTGIEERLPARYVLRDDQIDRHGNARGGHFLEILNILFAREPGRLMKGAVERLPRAPAVHRDVPSRLQPRQGSGRRVHRRGRRLRQGPSGIAHLQIAERSHGRPTVRTKSDERLAMTRLDGPRPTLPGGIVLVRAKETVIDIWKSP